MKSNVMTGCALALLSLCCACSSVTESTPIPDFEPDALVALGEKEISVWDLIGESVPGDSVSTEELRVTLQYLQEKALVLPALALYNITADTLLYGPYFEIDAAVVGGTFGVPLAKSVFLGRKDTLVLNTLAEGIKIKRMENGADFEYVFPYTGFEYQVTVTLKNVYMRGTKEPVVIQEIVDKDNQKGVRRKLNAEFDVDLSGGNKLYLETSILISKGGVLFEPQTIALLVKSVNMKLEKAVGYFPVPPLQLSDDNLKMNLDILSDLSNAFDLSDPRYCLIIKNKGFGLPAEVEDLVLQATNISATRSVNLTTEERMAFEANIQNTLRTDTFVFTAENSNLLEFLKLPPHGNIRYSGTIHFNPQGNVGEDNVIYADGVSQVDSYLEIPMVMKGNTLVYQDTLTPLNFGDKPLSVARVTVSSDTDIPFTLTLGEISFYDEQQNLLGKVEFHENLQNGKALNGVVAPELLQESGRVKYGVATLYVYPSLDVLSIRQDAVLKMNYSLLGETENVEK